MTSPTAPDAASLQKQAALAGHDLAADRAASLADDVAALARADRRLATVDLGTAPASGPPWGRSDD